MNFNYKIIGLVGLAIFFLCTGFSKKNPATPNTGSLSVSISGMTDSKGLVRVVLYKNAATFLAENDFAAADSAAARAGGCVNVTLHNLPFGEYAAAFYQDKNNNGVFDLNIFHIPIEPYAFSNGVHARWKLPDFNSAAFHFAQPNQHIEVTLLNWSKQ